MVLTSSGSLFDGPQHFACAKQRKEGLFDFGPLKQRRRGVVWSQEPQEIAMSQQSLALPDSVESVFDVRDIAPLDLGGHVVAPELLPPGAVPGHSKGSFCLPMTNAQYHSQRSFISHSGMIELLRSPAHYF